MTTYFVAFLVSLMSGLVLTLLVRNRAHAWGLLDQASDSRKIHQTPIPRLGGVAIVLAFFAPLVALLLVDSGVGAVFREQQSLIIGLFGGGAAIAILGLYDDLKGIRARHKLAVQIAVAVALYFTGFKIQVISLPFGATLDLGYAALPFTVFWLVGIVNAVNLIDGLDGLAGGVALFAAITNFVLAVAQGNVVLALIMAALAGALIGFLFFNFNPASIFMGDTGSMFLGFVLAAVAIKTSSKSGTVVSLLIPITALGLPIMDTLLAMTRRAMTGRPVFSADREHIHHRVMRLVASNQRKAVLALYGLCTLFTLIALALHWSNGPQTTVLLLAVSGVVLAVAKKLGFLSRAKLTLVGAARRRNSDLRSLEKSVTDDIRRATSLDQIWSSVRELATGVDAATTELTIIRPASALEDRIRFESRRTDAFGSGVTVSRPLNAAPGVMGELRLCWVDGRMEVDRDQEVAIENVAMAISEATRRLSSPPTVNAPARIQLRSA